jgi:hypothetical protein
VHMHITPDLALCSLPFLCTTGDNRSLPAGRAGKLELCISEADVSVIGIRGWTAKPRLLLFIRYISDS